MVGRAQMDVRRRRATRRTAVALLAGCVLLLSACAGTTRIGQAGSVKRPNIIFVLTDDLSNNLLPYMPHVTALAHQGTSFSHYYVVDSLCCPSRAAILTGRYPHDDGVFTNHASNGGYSAFDAHDDQQRTFASTLQHAGYRTALMGKYLNGYQPEDPIPTGWNEWDVGGDAYREFDYTLNQDGLQVEYGRDKDDYLTDVLSDRSGAFLDDASHHHTPFALEVATFAPHRPATPAPRYRHSFSTIHAPHGAAWNTTPTDPPSWLADFPPLSAANTALIDKVYRKRVESAQSIDDLVGHLETRLRADHELRDTYFVFSSDNGYHEGQYRLLPGKQTAFDTDIRVPLIVAGPGVPEGRTISSLASSIDLAPTFDQIAGTSSTTDPDGVSLLSLLHGQAAPADWQQAVLVEHRGPDDDRSDPDYQPHRSGDPPSYEAIRTASALYVEYRDGQREYYDTDSDPDELHNLASTAPASVLAPLHATLQAMAHCHGATQCQAAAQDP